MRGRGYTNWGLGIASRVLRSCSQFLSETDSALVMHLSQQHSSEESKQAFQQLWDNVTELQAAELNLSVRHLVPASTNTSTLPGLLHLNKCLDRHVRHSLSKTAVWTVIQPPRKDDGTPNDCPNRCSEQNRVHHPTRAMTTYIWLLDMFRT